MEVWTKLFWAASQRLTPRGAVVANSAADCSSHYPQWRDSYPERAEKFVPGGFGENFVTARMNERNVCIGDIVSVGNEALLQVSLPRQPCYKLNHRFSLKQFAPMTYQTSRTGWYYRVIREGSVQAGDEVRLVERKWPKWTIERIQEYLHRDKDNLEMNEQLAGVDDLGAEAKGQFRNRVAKAKRKLEPKKLETWKDFKIVSRKMETPRIVSLVFEAVTPDPQVENSVLGAHAKIKLPSGLERTYSLVSGDGEGFSANNKFELGIALDENSRGGSRYFHQSTKIDDIIQVGKITTDVNFASAASHHVFVAGGIGITAFLPLIKGIQDMNYSFTLHYAVRSSEDVPFKDRLEPWGDNVVIYDKSRGQRMNVKEVVKTVPWNSHLYVCGPNRLMEAAKEAVQESDLTPNEVHYEAFAADISGDPFEAEITNRSGKVVSVGAEETLLEVLRRELGDSPSSCEVGNCGTCKIALKRGRVDHRGTALAEEDKETSMLACVSRGIGRIAVEV